MRVLIAEDGALFREGLQGLLERHGHDVVAAVGDADSVLPEVLRLRPDIAVIDIRMPSVAGIDGAGAAVAVREKQPDCGVLLLSQHVELRGCQSLIGTPGFGYLLKDRVLDVAEFIQALERIADGGSVLDPVVVRSLVQSSRPGRLDVLTEREREVLALVAEGDSNSTIATRLYMSPRTVESHMRAIFLKLGIPDDGKAHRRVLAVIAYLNE